jgi:hypothetical protein
LVLINPTILLLISVVLGTLLYDKVGFSVPIIASIIKIEQPKIKFFEQIKFGILYGFLAGVLIILVGTIFKSSLPQEFIELGKKVKITTFARFLYGGFTEELLIRFGFMTLVVWIVFKLTPKVAINF